MAAKDYTFAEGMTEIYLVKRTKNRSHLMSNDRRPLTKTEQCYIFEHFLRRYCDENKTDSVIITNADGKKLFTATLIDKTEE